MPPLVLAMTTFLLLCPAGVATIDEALAAARRGEDLADRIPPAVARAATERLGRAPVAELEPLAAIARAGKAVPEAARALAARIDRKDEAGIAAIRVLRSLPSGAASESTLADLLERGLDADTSRAACELIVRGASASAVVTRLTTWASDNAALYQALLQAVPQGGDRPAELLEALSGMDIKAPAQQAQLTAAMSDLIDQRPAAARRALELVGRGDLGPGGATARALGAYPIDKFDEVAQTVRNLLSEAAEGSDAVAQAAALDASAKLLLPEAIPVAQSLSAPGKPSAVRIAAVNAIGALCFGDAATIDRLIGLLSDSDAQVAAAACAALTKRTGQRLPGVPNAWTNWRNGRSFPDPVDAEEYLNQQRGILARVRARKRTQTGQ